MENPQISQKILVFHGRQAPEMGFLVGYTALIDYYKLQVPIPDTIALISQKNRKYNQTGWRVYSPKYFPDETLIAHLVFALKYEGGQLALEGYKSLKPDRERLLSWKAWPGSPLIIT